MLRCVLDSPIGAWECSLFARKYNFCSRMPQLNGAGVEIHYFSRAQRTRPEITSRIYRTAECICDRPSACAHGIHNERNRYRCTMNAYLIVHPKTITHFRRRRRHCRCNGHMCCSILNIRSVCKFTRTLLSYVLPLARHTHTHPQNLQHKLMQTTAFVRHLRTIHT